MVNLMINGATGWQVADLGKDAQVALTFEESSIAEVSFKCSGSIEFDLPATTKNRAIFSNINERQVRGTAAYNQYECKLSVDWIPVFTQAYCIVNKTTLQAFTVSIISGTADIFTRLKEVDFEKYPECLGAVHRTSSYYDMSKDAKKDGIIQQVAAAGGKVCALPLVPLTTIKERLEAFGKFTMPIPISAASNAFPADYYISFRSRKRADEKTSVSAMDVLQQCKGDYISTQTELRKPKSEQYFIDATFGGDFRPTKVKQIGLHAQIVLHNTNTAYSNAKFRFIIGYNGVWYNMQYTLNGRPLDNGFYESYAIIGTMAAEVYVKDLYFYSDGSCLDRDGNAVSGAIRFTIADIASDCSEMYWGYAEYEITKTEQIAGITYLTYSPAYPSGCYYCSVQPMLMHENEYAETYGKMNIAANLGYKNALELYRALMQAFGLIAHYDARNGLLTYQLADVRANKANALDWSDKLVSSTDEHHASGYAQETTYAMEKDSEVDVQQSYLLRIADNTLDATKSVAVSLMSGSNRSGFRWYRETESGNQWKELKYPYLVAMVDGQITFDAPLLFSGYNYIEQLAQDGWREVTADMVLSIIDISQLNTTRPIFLRQYGAYFYVQKIENWQNKQSCKVKLLRI